MTASIFLTNKELYICSMSMDMDGIWFISEPYFKINQMEDINLIGHNLKESLLRSKSNVKPIIKFEDYLKNILQKVGLTSPNQLYSKTSKKCTVEVDESNIVIQPMINNGKRSYVNLGSDIIPPLYIDINASNAMIGEKVLESLHYARSYNKDETILN